MDIKNSIIAILNNKGKIVGTGFVAGKNLILTCAHVVEEATAGLNERVTICFSNDSNAEAIVEQKSFSPSYEKDVALLCVDFLPEGITPLPLGNAVGSAGHNFHAFGYAIVTDVQGIGASGDIVEIVDNGRLVQLRSQEPDHGMSGGPVLDDQRRVVVGMITKGKNQAEEDKSLRNIYTTFATSVEVIREVCSELQLTAICPYRNLNVFNEEDEPFFFGRDKVVQKLVDSLKREPRFLAVLGPSGSGKSSVVRAGLIPLLRQGKVPGSQKWEIVTIRPSRNPFEQLAAANFITPQSGLENSIRTRLADLPEKTKLILFIDQFEEVLAITPGDIRQKFISELTQLLNAPVPITVILTLRDDFYSRFLRDAAMLTSWLERGLVNTPPILEKDDLREMILEPAKMIGLSFDEGLVDQIITEACEANQSNESARSTILPLLESALTQLWELRKDERLTHDSYRDIGGTAGSLSQWADRIYYQLSPRDRNLAEQIFCELVHLGNEKEKVPDTRRMILISELGKRYKGNEIEQVVNQLVQSRLLSTEKEEETEQQYIEIIHDALLHEWKLLEQWIDKYRHREQIARERRRRWIIFGLSIGLVLMIGLATVAILQRNEAVHQAQIALARQLVAQAESINALRSSNQMFSVLLATRSMEIFQSSEASQVLLYNTTARPLFHTTHKGEVRSVAFSKDGKYIASGGGNSVIVLDSTTGLTVARMTHKDLVYSVAFSPSGSYVASGGHDGKVCIWEIATSKRVYCFTKDDGVYMVIYSPDGKYVAAGGEQFIDIWDVSTGSQVARLKVNTGRIYSLCYSFDGKLLASGDSKNARVWDWSISKEIARLKHTEPVLTVAFSPDGKQIISGSEDFTARVWDVGTETEIARREHAGAVTSVAFHPDGKIVISGSRDNTVRIWNASNGSELLRLNHDGSVFVAAFSQDGKYIVTGSADNTARIWEAGTGREVARMTHDALVSSAAFSPDGKRVVSGSYDQTVRVWETSTSAEQARMAHDGKVYSVSFSPNGKYALSAGSDNTVRVWDNMTGEIIYQLTQDGDVFSAAFSKDGKYVVSAGGPTIVVSDIAARKEIARFKATGELYSVAFSPDETFVVASGSDTMACVWMIAPIMDKAQTCMQHDNEVHSVAISPNSKYVVSGSNDHSARVWDAMTGNEIARMAHDSEVHFVAFSPDGKFVVSGDAKIAKIWDAMTGKQISQMVHKNFVYSAAFSPDGKYIVSGGGLDVKVWEVLTGKEITNMLHGGTVNWVAFSPDGKYVASGDDKAARVWEAMTGKEIARMLHNNLVKSIAFSPNGKYVISGGVDRTARIWLWKPDDLIASTCSSLPRNLTRSEWETYLGGQPFSEICPGLPVFTKPYSNQ
jgi:WD40 repeat protein